MYNFGNILPPLVSHADLMGTHGNNDAMYYAENVIVQEYKLHYRSVCLV